ncbi:hypothetical protein ATS75_00250 [Pseudoalteromonas sp. H105]|nr:hypothetical protein ATS75_00250 [Pseudoalteromonas sp. H105]
MIQINAKPKICFASPVLEGSFTQSESLNKRLSELFFDLEKQGYKNKTKLNTTLGNIFDSPGDLFSLTQYEDILEIRRLMNGALTSWILETSNWQKDDLNNLKFEFESWFHISRFGATKSLHDHGQCSWSMIYYVDAGDAPTVEFPRSGYLQIYDPRHIQQNPDDQGFFNLKAMFDYGGFAIRPNSGKFVIFPGYLEHEVVTYFGNRPRIMIALNCLIRKK